MKTVVEESMDVDDVNGDRIDIEYFTDPLCCWSWAFEPHWRRFVNEYKDRINWRYRMVGMIPDWSKYSDPVNDISRPAQMGPLWMQVKHTTGINIDANIWLEDPPQSSFPACMAVKCAEMQSAAAADILLYQLRKAVMTEKKNIAKPEIILKIAEESAWEYKVLDYRKLKNDFTLNKAAMLFKEDLQKTKLNEIGRYPALTMLNAEGKGLVIVGYRPYPVLVAALMQLNEVFTQQQ